MDNAGSICTCRNRGTRTGGAFGVVVYFIAIEQNSSGFFPFFNLEQKFGIIEISATLAEITEKRINP